MDDFQAIVFGDKRETEYVTVEEAIFIHFMVMKETNDLDEAGVKDMNMLESAIGRPQQSAFGEDAYPDLFLKTAALFDSMVNNHGFHNGNKRTAVVVTDTFLKKNGSMFDADPKVLEDFTVAVAYTPSDEDTEVFKNRMRNLLRNFEIEEGESRLPSIANFIRETSIRL